MSERIFAHFLNEMKFRELCEKLNEGEAIILLERLFGVRPAIVFLDQEREYDEKILLPIIEKRENNVPLQYILGEWEFMGHSFIVTPACLIPRPDTEVLVEKALKVIKKGDRVADFCTGSGCIGLSLLLFTPLENITLVDLSSDALEVARGNAKKHYLENRCELILGDICTLNFENKFDVIVSNPPYIPSRDIDTLSSEVKKEPRLALDGGEDGLDIIRFLLDGGILLLNEGGKMLIEFGYDQREQIEELSKKALESGRISSYEIIYDYGKNPRVLFLKR